MKKEYKDYLHKNINNDFGISVDKLAPQITNIGRFQAWLGGDVSKIKKVLNIVKSEGVSPAFFAAYESSEGVSMFGWLNHTTVQGDAYNDARQVARWIVSQSKKQAQPAWIDVGTNNWDIVPASVKQEGNADAKSYNSGDIGRVIISGTAAATWSVYYPDALKGSVNGVQDYGNPMEIQVSNIKKWGGDLGHTSSGDSGDSGSSSGDDLSDLFSGLGSAGQKLLKRLFDEIEEMLTYDLHSIGTDMFFSNQYFKLFKTYNNTYRIQINVPFFDTIEKLIGSLDFGSDDDNGSNDDNGSDDDNGSNGKYNTKYITSHHRNFRYGKTVAETQANGYPFAGKAHHGNDYNFVYEELKSPVSGTVNGNNGHGFTVNDGGIGYDGDGSGWGNRIVIKLDDGSGRSMLFGHLSKMNVKAGDKVKVGQVIGVTGNTGEMTTGPHLHVELVDPNNSNRASDRTIDPTPFLEKYS